MQSKGSIGLVLTPDSSQTVIDLGTKAGTNLVAYWWQPEFESTDRREGIYKWKDLDDCWAWAVDPVTPAFNEVRSFKVRVLNTSAVALAVSLPILITYII